MSHFDLTLSAETGSKYVPFLRKHLLLAHKILNPALTELSLALVGDARMSRLHKEFMDIDGATDVLTFPLEQNDQGQDIAGEVVICVPEAARQASSRGTAIDRELLLYALHGMLHLSGFDDRTEAGFRRMHRMEDDILTQLGLGPVFGITPARGDRRKPRPHVKTARAASRSGKRIGKPTRRRARAGKRLGA
jgi:probable rRNA maturation factor